MLTDIFIINLLNIEKYIIIPKTIPKNIYDLSSPFVNFITENITIIPENSQNKISCIYVTKSNVFIIFLWILKKSNRIPIIIPVITNISNVVIWFDVESFKFLKPFYLNILPKKLLSFFSKFLSL